MLKKKGLYLLTLLILSTLIASCGSSNTQTQTKDDPAPTEAESENIETTNNESSTPEMAKWYQLELVDEFGDPVKDAEPVIAFPITGTFSNTATTDSPLSGIIYATKNPSGDNDYIVGLQLYEYDGKNKVSYLNSSDIILRGKVKFLDSDHVSDEVTEYKILGESPNGDLFLSDYCFNGKDWWHHGGRKLLSHIDIPADVHLILTIDGSTYDFWVYYSNFNEMKGLIGYDSHS